MFATTKMNRFHENSYFGRKISCLLMELYGNESPTNFDQNVSKSPKWIDFNEISELLQLFDEFINVLLNSVKNLKSTNCIYKNESFFMKFSNLNEIFEIFTNDGKQHEQWEKKNRKSWRIAIIKWIVFYENFELQKSKISMNKILKPQKHKSMYQSTN